MFFISCKNGDLYGVKDTSDNVVEMYTVHEILKCIDAGIDIRGISIIGGKVSIKCISDNVLNDFVKVIKPTLSKLKLLGVIEYNEQVKRIQKLAVSYGIILRESQLSIDIKSSKLFINSQAFKTFVDFSSFETIDEIDACDDKVSELSRLGVNALDKITLKVSDSLTITMKDVLNEIRKVDNALYYRDVRYIGITPSNRMLKICIFDEVFSVKVDTIEYIKKNYKKILETKVDKAYGFEDYVCKSLIGNQKYAISKYSRKPLRAEDNIYTLIDVLKKKYKTLHDVYLRMEV